MNINNKNLCPVCFTPTDSPCCNEINRVPVALPVGTILLGRYIIGKTLGKGGFGITYLAYDVTSDKRIAVKEYLPDTLSHRSKGESAVETLHGEKADAFKSGAEKFYEEAQMVSRFNGNPGLIWVYEFFYENNTAYFVMEYLEGMDLKQHIIQKGGYLNEQQVMDIITPLIDSLIIVHSIGVLHRDISPDNIYMTNDGKVKLLDFGAARQVLGEASKSLSVILKQGFAPIEQYQTKGKQGPWTDIYALGATIYHSLTGKIPEAPMDRIVEDNLTMPENISDKFKAVLSKMLAVHAKDRYQDVITLKNALQITAAHDNINELPGAQTAPVEIIAPNRKRTLIYAIASVCAVLVITVTAIVLITGSNDGDDSVLPVIGAESDQASDNDIAFTTTGFAVTDGYSPTETPAAYEDGLTSEPHADTTAPPPDSTTRTGAASTTQATTTRAGAASTTRVTTTRAGAASTTRATTTRAGNTTTAATTRPPATTSRPPATTSRPPATTSRPPATTSRPPATTSRPPATTAPSAVSPISVQLIAQEAVDWSTSGGNHWKSLPRTISGNGTYTLTITITGGYTSLAGLGLVSEGATFNYPHIFDNSVLPNQRWWDATVSIDSVMVNGTVRLGNTWGNDWYLISRGYSTVEGYVNTILWNAWETSERRLTGVTSISSPGDPSSTSFQIPGGGTISTITVTFTVRNFN
jgi:serine/threonine protein kinase